LIVAAEQEGEASDIIPLIVKKHAGQQDAQVIGERLDGFVAGAPLTFLMH